MLNSGKLEITGDTFNCDYSDFVVEGYNVYANGTDYKVVTSAPEGYTLVTND